MREVSVLYDEAVEMAAKKSDITVPYLRLWRAKYGVTQQELAEQAGLVRSTILSAENGKPVSVVTLGKLARGLGISIHDLRYTDPSTLPDGEGGTT